MQLSIRQLTLGLLAMCFSHAMLGQKLSPTLTFSSRLNGMNEVPSVNAAGQGVFTLTVNPDFDKVRIEGAWNNLSGPLTGAHIHIGDTGVAGSVVFNLMAYRKGYNRISGEFAITETQLRNLLEGKYYVNLHTQSNPNGEIRGQVYLENDYHLHNMLNGDQEVPKVNSTAYGVATATLSIDKKTLHVRAILLEAQSTITAAHLHYGAAGVNGAVVFPLNIADSMIDQVISLDTIPQKDSFVRELMSNRIYLNVHTTNNPNGEARAQLVYKPLTWDAFLTGDQEVPANSSTAKGVGTIWNSADLDSVYYIFVMKGIDQTYSAHFHTGMPGQNGPVVINLGSDIVKNRIFGGRPMNSIWRKDALMGNLYVNIHTADFPNGEIRGQILKHSREGYAYEITGGQQVPPAQTPAQGFGMASIEREGRNLHFMAVWDSLTSPFASSHFHIGSPGQNGGVVFNVTPFVNNDAAYGYWYDTSSPDLSNGIIRAFDEGRIYYNIHTDSFPNGEIRGNVTKGSMLATSDSARMMVRPMFNSDLLFSAKLNGSNEVPAVNTNAEGLGGFWLNATHDTLWVNVALANINADSVTGAHIHSGYKGQNGPVVISLMPMLVGNRIKGYITSDSIMSGQALARLFKGGFYINVHSAASPNGEIRAQLLLEQDYLFTASMDEAQDNNTGPAYGLSTFMVSQNWKNAEINGVWSNLGSTVVGAHIHKGATGVNGPVVVSLTPGISSNNSVSFMLDSMMLKMINKDTLMMGGYYVNIHTNEEPNGHIRGQLMEQKGLSFYTMLNSGFDSLPGFSTGRGIGYANYLPGADTISYYFMTQGLTSGVDSAAIFTTNRSTGARTTIFDLGNSVDSFRVRGTQRGNTSTVAGILQLLRGNGSALVSTGTYPDGEIAGQLWRTARDGYSFDICGEQEPGTAGYDTAGTGAAIVSIDARLTNVHYMVVLDSFKGTINAAHFHRAAQGQNGPVVKTIKPPFTTNSGYGYWSKMDSAQAFDTTAARNLQNGLLYLNFHTALYPNGALRGQIVKRSICVDTLATVRDTTEDTTSIMETFRGDLKVQPVPFSNELNIIAPEFEGTANLEMINSQGQIVITERLMGKANLRIETENLSKGLYLIRITKGDALPLVLRVVKQ